MILRGLAAVSSLALLATGACESAPTAAAMAEPDADLAELAAMMAGRWDNDRQVFFASDFGYDPDDPPGRHHWQIEPDRQGAPAILTGWHERAGAAPLRLRHMLSFDIGRGAIRHEMQVPDAAAEFDCVLYWQRAADGFRGTGEGGDCARIAPGPGEGAQRLTHRLSADEYRIEAGHGDDRTTTLLRRARRFSCWVAILRGAVHGDSGAGLDDWDFRRGVSLHDQGGEAELVTDETPPRRIRLRLRDVDWPTGDRRPSLTLYVLAENSERPVSYAWTEGGADRVGINLRWVQASCTHTPDPALAR